MNLFVYIFFVCSFLTMKCDILFLYYCCLITVCKEVQCLKQCRINIFYNSVFNECYPALPPTPPN